MKKRSSRVLSILLAVCLTAAIAIPVLADGNSTLAEIFRGVTVYVDGTKVEPKNAEGGPADPFIVDNSTYLPARAISDALGAEISWDEATYNVYIDTLKADPKAAEYLTEYFEIEPMTGTVSAETYTAALAAVFGEDAVAMTGTTLADAVAATVANCGLAELPATYSAEKAIANTTGVMGVTEENAATVATALDAALASGTWNYAAELDGDTATQLLMNAVNIAGKGRRTLGLTTDPDISLKLRNAYRTLYDFTKLDDESIKALWSIADTIINRKATTGVGFKSDDYDSRFLPGYTVQYGHSNINHAIQLVALLASNGIEAQVALEPKISSFEYGGHLNDTVMEYDMDLEFATTADREAFHDMINNYVTRGMEGNTVSQIKGAWLTPCFNSYAEIKDYDMLYDNVVACGKYSIHPFSTEAQMENISAIAQEVADEFNATLAEGADPITYEAVKIWCNPAFAEWLISLS